MWAWVWLWVLINESKWVYKRIWAWVTSVLVKKWLTVCLGPVKILYFLGVCYCRHRSRLRPHKYLCGGLDDVWSGMVYRSHQDCIRWRPHSRLCKCAGALKALGSISATLPPSPWSGLHNCTPFILIRVWTLKSRSEWRFLELWQKDYEYYIDIEENKSQCIFDNFQKFAKNRIFVNFEHFLPWMVA